MHHLQADDGKGDTQRVRVAASLQRANDRPNGVNVGKVAHSSENLT
jgi:hypothetical protein